MKIAVVIPNWNGADLIANCLQSLEAQTLKADVIVVDNGSYDDSVIIIEERFPEVTLIELHKNTGFAGGVNAGIRYAQENGYDAVALFNNDAVADKNWLKELATVLEDNTDVGIATCKLMRSDKKHFDSTGDFYTTWGTSFPRGRNHVAGKHYTDPEYVFGASGGASLYRITTLNDIGLFDERFFAYYEDVDLSFRAQLAGWKIYYQPKSVAYHLVGATSSKMGGFARYHSIKNFYILYTKNMPSVLYWFHLPTFLLQGLRTFVRSVLDMQLHIWLKAYGQFLIYLPSILIDRFKIQRRRKVSLDYIEKQLHVGRAPHVPDL
jgi:GT2 family glycosyltransferase